MTKTYLIRGNQAKPCTMQGHTLISVDNVRATPADQLIDDLLAMKYEITKSQFWGDDMDGCELLIAAEQGERNLQ